MPESLTTQAQALVATVEAHTAARRTAPNAGRKHLTADEVAVVLQLHAQGLTQEQIAESFEPPKSQGTISRALFKFSPDRTAQAKQMLRASAPAMAMNVIRKGRAQDHINALKGLGVLEETQQQGLTVIVGGDSIVNIGLGVVSVSPTLSPSVLTVESESVRKA